MVTEYMTHSHIRAHPVLKFELHIETDRKTYKHNI